MRQEARQKLIDAGLVIGAEGIDDFTRGHISIRDPEDPNFFFMKPHSFGLDEITEENIVTCALSGEKVAGGGRRHSEVFIHSEILKARPEINSVLHAHPKNAIAVSAIGKPLRRLSLASLEFADGIGMFDETCDLIRSPELGAKVNEALGSHRALLLRNHGVVVVGRSIEECIFLTIQLENACAMQMLVGDAEAREISYEEAKALQAKVAIQEQYKINFDYMVRKARRRA